MQKKISLIAGLLCIFSVIAVICVQPLLSRAPLTRNRPQSAVTGHSSRGVIVSGSQSSTMQKGLKKKLKKLREYVKSVLEDSNVPGLGMGIVKDGRVIFAEGFGYRNAEKKLPVTTQTLFAIGSMTKSFTAMGIGMLVADGKIDWREPVRTYLPEFAMKDPYITASITLRDMVTHRTGMARYDRLWMGSPFSRKEIVHKLRYLDCIYGFRERHQYTSNMYIAAGYIAGAVNNSTWEDLIRERIFKPLGMNRSNMSVKDSQTDPDHAIPYWITNGKAAANPLFNVDSLGPGGSINSCVDDMLKWIQFNLNRGRTGDQQIIPAHIITDMHSPHTANDDPRNRMVSGEESYINYGLGWLLKFYRGHLYIGHGGGVPGGFSGVASFMPYDKIGVFVVNNGWSGISKILSWYAYDLLLGFEPRERYVFKNKQVKKTGPKKTKTREESSEAKSPTHPLAAYKGVYENEPFGSAKVIFKNGKLWLKFYTREYELEHVRYNVFRAKYRADMDLPAKLEYRRMLVKFSMNYNGVMDRLTLPLDDRADEFVFVKSKTGEVPEHLKGLKYLIQYTGKFELMGDVVVVRIIQDKLTAITRDGEKNVLIPEQENEFSVKNNPEFRIVFKMVNKKVVAFDFHRPDGVFTGKKISHAQARQL